MLIGIFVPFFQLLATKILLLLICNKKILNMIRSIFFILDNCPIIKFRINRPLLQTINNIIAIGDLLIKYNLIIL